MKRRDILSEIISKRQRSYRRNDAYQQASNRLESLIYAQFHLKPLPKENKQIKQELIRYFSVGFASCLEGYFRAIIKELIDYGEPFRSNASKLEDIKLDIKNITGIQDKKISVGEIVSHMVKLSSINDIQRHMSTLMGFNYFAKVKTQIILRDEIFDEFNPHAWETLNETFVDRHISCHELNPSHKYTFKRVEEQWRTAWNTIDANEALLQELGIRENNKENS